MALGTLLSVWLCAQVFGMEVALHLLGPLGASAVLLFAVSSGALAQPWSIIGSYLCAAVVALLVARVLGRTLGSACLAAGMTVILICWLRCLHPPGVALAHLGSRARPVVSFLESFSNAMFYIVGLVMRVAPIAAFGAISFTVGKYGFSSIAKLAQLMGTMYLTCFLFVFVVLGPRCAPPGP
eukprot:gene4329-5128_t